MTTTNFFDIVDNPSLFDFKGFNLFKVFYVRYQNKFIDRSAETKPTNQLLEQRPRFHLIIALIRMLFLGIKNRFSSRILFYGASGRHLIIENTIFDLYNARIVGELGRDKFVIVEDRREGIQKHYTPDLILDDFKPITRLLRRITLRFVYGEIEETAQRIIQAFPKLNFSEDEAKEIIFNFYCHYLTTRLLLFVLNPKRAFLICHYWRESFIAACKRNNIFVIELMHGTITAQHPFYNYPIRYKPYFKNALFPDEISVYGEYWRKVLINGNMLPSASITVCGYYVKTNNVANHYGSLPARNGKKVILIATQWTLQAQFLAYITFIKSQLDREQWRIVIKPHPVENVNQYTLLEDSDFVIVTSADIYQLLAECDIHISAYSTVLYEAARYDLCNYVLLFEEALNYSLEVLNSGVGRPLNPGEVPKLCMEKNKIDPEFYFAPYEPSVLFE